MYFDGWFIKEEVVGISFSFLFCVLLVGFGFDFLLLMELGGSGDELEFYSKMAYFFLG